MPVKHSFQSARSDSSDAGAIQPSHWNDAHELDGFLALLDSIAVSANSILALDASAQPYLIPTSQVVTLSQVNASIASSIAALPAVARSGSYTDLGNKPTLGTAAALNVGTAATDVVQLDGSSKLPAVDGSALTNVTWANVSGKPAIGTAANDLVQLDGTGKLPAVDGSQLTNLTGAEPIGAISFHPGATVPTNKIKANGALLSRTTYAALWAFAQASGNIAASDGAWVQGQFSPGDGSTTFRIPDFRGVFIRGFDDGAGIDSGRSLGSYQADAMQGHIHLEQAGVNSGSSYGWSAAASSTQSAIGSYTSVPASDGTNGTPRTAAETRPKNVALIACIKYQ